MKINLIGTESDKTARRKTIIVAAVFTLLVGLLATVGAGASYRAASRGTSVLGEMGNLFSLSDLKIFPWNSGSADSGPFSTPDGRLNILLLGIGGDGHDGAQLTDTIILASIDKNTSRVGLLSIPRDLAYPLGGGRFRKINAVNALNEVSHPGEGAVYTAKDFEKLFEVRIDRVIRLDFKGFEEFIDALGGVDVTVERSFSDSQYPTADDGPNPYHWTTISFNKGAEHMDGKRALTYVRSRHGSNGEGSDFARSRRQQIVLNAVRDKLVSLGTLGNPKKLTDLWTALSSHLQTNLTAWDLIKLIPMAIDYSKTKIVMNVMTDAADGELIPANVDGAAMLFPKKPDWTELRALAADPFTSKAERNKSLSPNENIVLEIRNGTLRTGFAAQAATKLEAIGYTVENTGNATKRGFERSVIYDLTGGRKQTELARLKKLLDADVSQPANGKIIYDNGAKENVSSSATEFLIVLGNSSLGAINPYAGTTNP
ncbi:MAG: LCP family protein [Patescibacteria group bacterium]